MSCLEHDMTYEYHPLSVPNPSPHKRRIRAVIALAGDDIPLLRSGHNDLSVLNLCLAEIDVTYIREEEMGLRPHINAKRRWSSTDP